MWIEESVDRESQQKLYVQLYGIIKGKIEKSEWPVGTLIPSEDELCKIFNVSKATVRLAVSELVRNGYLRRQQGKGTFVTFALPHTGMTVKTWLTEDIFGENLKVTRAVLLKGGEGAFRGDQRVPQCRGSRLLRPVQMSGGR